MNILMYLGLHYKFIWMGLGIIMICLEMVLVSGFGFLFAGLGAFTTFACLEFHIIDSNFIVELIMFLISSIAWGVILWYPIKLLKADEVSYQALLGSVVILSDDVEKDKIDTIIWSGVGMRATLDENEKSLVLKKGTKAKITSIKGNVLYLSKGD